MYVASFLLALSAVGVGADLAAQSPDAAPWTVLPEESVFAVVTEKAGFAARLAHNHLIVASDYNVALDFDPDRPSATAFEFEARVAGLLVDSDEERIEWESAIRALDLVSELGTPGEDDRRKIREEMLADGQLDAEEHPTLSARLVAVREEISAFGSVEFSHVAEVEVQIRGQSVVKDVSARFQIDEADENRVNIEVVGQFMFEEFGIEPYSAFMGSVKNKNEFDIYLSVKAVR